MILVMSKIFESNSWYLLIYVSFFLSGCLERLPVLLAEDGVNVREALGTVELLRCLSGDGLELQHPGPEVWVVVVEVPQLRPFGVGAEPAAASVSEVVNRRKESRLTANVIKLAGNIRDKEDFLLPI